MIFFKNLANGFDVGLVNIFSSYQIDININNNKNIEFFCKNFVDIFLKAGKSISKTKKYKLIFEIVILYLENYFLFITILNFYLIYVY